MIAEALHIISDPAHVLAELVFIAVEGVIAGLVARPLIRRHDRRKHGA